MDVGASPEDAMCRICEGTVPAAELVAHTEYCRIVQNAAEARHRSDDTLASVVTAVQVHLQRASPAAAAGPDGNATAGSGLGSRRPSIAQPATGTGTGTPPMPAARLTTGAAAGNGSASPAAQSPSMSSTPPLPTDAPQRQQASPVSPAAEELLQSLVKLAQEALRLDHTGDITVESVRLTDGLRALAVSASAAGVAGTLAVPDQQILQNCLRSAAQAVAAKEEALLSIRRCLQARPDADLALKSDSLPRVDDFIIHRTISRGSFGEVLLARKKSTHDYYAIKVMRKKDLVRKNQMLHVLTERKLMAQLNSPYIIKLYYSFQTVDSLYMVMEYANGGDVAMLLRNVTVLSEPWARFYAAEVVQALDHIHALGIVHRDIKPDNLLISANGHIKLADFGLSQDGIDRCHVMPEAEAAAAAANRLAAAGINIAEGTITEEQRQMLVQAHRQERRQLYTQVGAVDYMAPEVLLGRGHDTAVDWWTLGVCLYEFLVGLPPFFDESVEVCCGAQATCQRILTRTLVWPQSMSPEARDLLDKLLQTEPSRRLGARGADEVRQHPFFRGIDWANLHQSSAAHVPVIASLDDGGLDDYSAMPSLGSIILTDENAEARRSQEDLLHDPEQLAQFQFKNTMLLADMNRSLAGHAPTAVGAALPSASLLEDQFVQPMRKPDVALEDNRRIRCLVAEDNPVTQQLIRGLMQQMGATITQAFTGTETVRYACSEKFDLIFMDIMMPEMEGTAATREIRSRVESLNRHTPIVAFTALGDWNEHEYERIGMNDLLAKPFTRQELYAVFTKWLHKEV